ncbi:hypothetical protein DFS33DRAFT_1336779 [Desarmillaria ectypa]|nr:hypothetical protein DFS33DRAFT_1336779 [Desarmillaria ectypa]
MLTPTCPAMSITFFLSFVSPNISVVLGGSTHSTTACILVDNPLMGSLRQRELRVDVVVPVSTVSRGSLGNC